MSEISTQTEVRSGSATAWADADASDGDASPVLASGELGIVSDTGQLAVGDGSNRPAGLLVLHRPSRIVNVTLAAGTKVVSDTHVTANSIIIPVLKTLGTITAPKAVACTARTAGTSFTITSADNTDTSTYQVVIIEP